MLPNNLDYSSKESTGIISYKTKLLIEMGQK